jgi:hypothetical protein
MNDYRLANFTACTDFWVGEAARYMTATLKLRITVRYRSSANPSTEEKQIIRDLLISGIRLLNCLPRYDYQVATETEERDAIYKYCDLLTSAAR